MLDAVLLDAAGMLALAAATHRFRRDSGVTSAAQARGLRIAGAALLAGALPCCATPMVGEWSVRFLVAASIAGLGLVLALSQWPATLFRPVRWALRAAQRVRGTIAGSSAARERVGA